MATYELISTTTLSSPTNTVTLSSIPQTYDDLYIVMIAKSTQPTYYTYGNLRANNVSTTSYVRISAFTDSTGGNTYGTASDTAVRSYGIAGNYASSTYGYMTWWFPKYSNANTPKTIYSDAGVPQTNTNQITGFFGNSVDTASGISTITIENQNTGYNIDTGSKFYIYGIKNS